MLNKNSNIRCDNAIAVLVCLLSVFGMISLTGIRILGVTLTAYRIAIPVILIYYLFCIIKDCHFDLIKRKGYLDIKLFMSFFAIWIIYGIIQTAIGYNLNRVDAIRELLALILGFMCIAIIIVLTVRGVQPKAFILVIKCIFIGLLVFAYIETIFGIHLETSKIYEIMQTSEKAAGQVKYLATTIFYNVNDYAAFITIFLPLFFISNNKKAYIFNLLVVALSVAMIIRLDAWISLFALGVSIIVWAVVGLLCKKERHISTYIKGLGVIAVFLIAYNFGHLIFDGLDSVLPFRDLDMEVEGNMMNESLGISDVLSAQLGENATGSSGSLRINTYLESIKNMFQDTFGLGYGPGNFSNYLMREADISNFLTNPHSLWVEIFVQYGVVIFVAYMIILVFLYISLIRTYLKYRSQVVLAAILIDTSYVLASFNPSSFLAYPYQWIVIGLSLAALMIKDLRGDKAKLRYKEKYIWGKL